MGLRVFGILYPILLALFLWQFGLNAAAGLTATAGAGFLLMSRFATHQPSPYLRLDVLGLVMLTLGGLAVMANSDRVLFYYPVLINILLFSVFFGSLFGSSTVIERLARIRTPNLPKNAVRYTRNVTVVWCAFFVFNGGIAFWTAQFATLEIWTFYNGFLAYVLMGALFAGELIVRRILIGDSAE